MSLLTHWKDSLDFFKPANLKLFMLASLNCLMRSLRVYPKFHLMNALVIIPFVLGLLSLSGELFDYIFKYYLFYFIVSMWVFQFILAARPSVERKDIDYFFMGGISGWFGIFYLIMPFALLFVSVITVLFFLDSIKHDRSFSLLPRIKLKGIFGAFQRALKMIIHFVLPISFLTFCTIGPIYLLMLEASCGCWQSIPKNWALSGLTGIYFLIMLLQFLFVAMMTTYYTKLKHTYKDFFFGKLQKYYLLIR